MALWLIFEHSTHGAKKTLHSQAESLNDGSDRKIQDPMLRPLDTHKNLIRHDGSTRKASNVKLIN